MEPTLLDYTNYISLASGVCLAYAYAVSFRGRDSHIEGSGGQFFLKFLDDLTSQVLWYVSYLKTNKIKGVEETSSKIEYYLNTKLLKPETQGSFSDASRFLNRVKGEVLSTENAINDKVRGRFKTRHLGKISFILFLYGLVLLLIPGIEKHVEIETTSLLVASNVLILFFAIICIVTEYDINLKIKSADRWYSKLWNFIRFFLSWVLYPRYLSYTLFFILAMFFFLKGHLPHLLETLKDCDIFVLYATLLMLYMGFVLYMTNSVIASLIHIVELYVKLQTKDVNASVRSFEEIISYHKDELDEIDKKLKDTKFLSDSFSVSKKDSSELAPP